VKPYQQVPIQECQEPLVPIPLDEFAVVSPHPYQRLGAPYGDRLPFSLRQGVVAALTQAQKQLQQDCPGWRFSIFDAYRPIPVQRFMVDYTLADLARSQGLDPATLTDQQRQTLLPRVYEFWSPPSTNPSTPPPHSTGAALDLSLMDATGQIADLGSPIDELSPRSYPDHFAHQDDEAAQIYHHRRQQLYRAMTKAGFQRHPKEWWHFSLGDQLWAWLVNQKKQDQRAIARYGAL